MSGIFSLSSSHNFLQQLAQGVLARYGHNPLSLADVLILLPNRRACIELKEAFSCQSGTSLILPKIHPLGELGGVIYMPDNIDTTKVPLTAIEQQIILTRLVWQWQQRNSHAGKHLPPSMDQAAALASTLVQFLGDVEREEIDLDKLQTLVPDAYAEHWHITLDFLSILSDFWPDILAEQNKISPVQYRNQMMDRITSHWEDNPPHYPVIAAGTTGSMPATRKLLNAIQSMPQGAIVLADLDQYMDVSSWETLTPSHPQYGFKRLLSFLQHERESITAWHQVNDVTDEYKGRGALLSEIMRPAATSHQWSQLGEVESYRAAVEHISYVEAATLQDEAKVIALQIRDAIEVPKKTVMLVTNEAGLAERVIIELQRWNIHIDYSAGKPLLFSPVALFLRHIIEVIETQAAPVALLSLLKHPYMAAGIKTVQCREFARFLEKECLRGVRIVGGLEQIIASLKKKAYGNQEWKMITMWLKEMHHSIQPLQQCFTKKNVSVTDLLAVHINVAEALATTDEETGAMRLWSNEQGEQLHNVLEHIMQTAGALGDIPAREYGALLKELMKSEVFRPAYGMHPRVKILTPIEARLQHADMVIFGGMNEGSWPKDPGIDPWMNQAMRYELGLPPHEQKIGMAAYDFMQLCYAKEVVLSRALKNEGAVTLPSRWLQRFIVVLKGLGLEGCLQPAHPWSEWAKQLSDPERPIMLQPPMPRPPVATRPQTLWVTQIEKLMRDPYSIYASHILRLTPLDPIDQDPGAAEFGNIIHDILEEFTQSYNDISSDNRLAWLTDCAEKYWQDLDGRPSLLVFWKSRFEHIATWFVDNEIKRRKDIEKVSGECQGEWKLSLSTPFILKARADRIEYCKDGSIALIDYKTGTLPDKKSIALGFAPQMTLEALIAQHGGFDNSNKTVRALEYWKLSGGEKAAFIDALKDIDSHILTALDGIQALLECFMQLETPYLCQPLPKMAPKYNDYEHLSRINEWRYQIS